MTQRIGIETPNGMVYLGDMVQLEDGRTGIVAKISHCLNSSSRIELIGFSGWFYPSQLRPIPPKKIVDMTDDEILDLAEDPKVWFRLSHESLSVCRKVNVVYSGSVGLGFDRMYRASDLLYTRDRGKTWHKLQKEVEG